MCEKDDLRLAIKYGKISIDSNISVDVFAGPKGANRFRSEKWNIKIGDLEFRMYSNLSHQISLDEQKKTLRGTVKIHLNRTCGEDYQKYSPQLERV